jgi:catalase-peroxidase
LIVVLVGLSWGDLITLAGTTAIEDMGGPVLGFCGGRIDDHNGADSLPLGPSDVQQAVAPCDVNGNCTEPLGSTTVGLIYVNPEGPMGNPIPEESAPQIRDTFGRMGMNDTETVALIGGGHAFGKTHGACPLGAGPNPHEDPANPWPGNCGSGVGNDTYTSGFEGPWTTSPTVWSNQYFHNLLDYDWEKYIGPGGHWQWGPVSVNGSEVPEIMMMTSDVSLLTDPEYLALVQFYADNMEEFERQFSHAWYKLTSRDMGPATRCIGDEVPPPQPFQYPLPPPPEALPNFDNVAADVYTVMYTPDDAVLPMDSTGSYGPLFVRLAWQCANTYRRTDYLGGCNGARIRFSPQIDWYANSYLDQALELLQPVKDKYGDSLTWADLIVLSGGVALEDAASLAGVKIVVPFVGGRSDATSGDTPSYLESPLTGGQTDDDIITMEDVNTILGLTAREYVVLVGGGHSIGQMHYNRSGFVSGSWTTKPAQLDNEWFTNVLNLDYSETGNDDHLEYTAVASSGEVLYMLKTDMNMRFDAEYRALVQEYASNATLFYKDFVGAWTKMMNADLFDIQTEVPDDTRGADEDDSDDDGNIKVGSGSFYGVLISSIVFFVATVFAAYYFGRVSGRASRDLKEPLQESPRTSNSRR